MDGWKTRSFPPIEKLEGVLWKDETNVGSSAWTMTDRSIQWEAKQDSLDVDNRKNLLKCRISRWIAETYCWDSVNYFLCDRLLEALIADTNVVQTHFPFSGFFSRNANRGFVSLRINSLRQNGKEKLTKRPTTVSTFLFCITGQILHPSRKMRRRHTKVEDNGGH